MFAGGRLTRADGLQLYAAQSLSWLGRLAQHVRAVKNADRVLFAAAPEQAETPREAATMRYGNAENRIDRVDDLLRVRELQDERNGFAVFVPLPERSTVVAPVESLRTFAVSRLILDNVVHISCDWTVHGLSVAQLALQFGADDLRGHDAAVPRDDLIQMIWDGGFRPVERGAGGEVIREYDPAPSLAERRSEPQRIWS